MTDQSRQDNLLDLLTGLLTLPIVIPPAIVLWQIYNWLQTAKWQPVAVSDAFTFFGIPYPHFQWLGLQKIAETVLDFPLSLTLFFLWSAAFVGTILYADGVRRKRDFL